MLQFYRKREYTDHRTIAAIWAVASRDRKRAGLRLRLHNIPAPLRSRLENKR